MKINSDIVVIADSNGKYVNTDLLYPIKGNKGRKFYCPCIEDAQLTRFFEHCRVRYWP